MDTTPVEITVPGASLQGDLTVPENATGLVVFAHGSGSSRSSPRNRLVARALAEAGLATLLADLLTSDEEAIDATTRHLRFDIGLLTRRLVAIIDWAREEPATRDLRLGLFGASTGAAAALSAAAQRPIVVHAVVSRGGRPDLAAAALPQVTAPTLLIVGEDDPQVLELNVGAASQLRDVALERVPGATHLFEEPGALEEVARLARDWFVQHLADPPAAGATDEAAEPDEEVALPFRDRHEAGRLLARRLASYAGRDDVIVLGLPRGGVPVAAAVADALHAPLDVVVVRKLGAPGYPELAAGAIAPDVCVLNPEVVRHFALEEIEAEAAEQQRELERRERRFRGDRPPPPVRGKIVLLVDDGLATGATMRAAVAWTRAHQAARVVVAVPVAPADTLTLVGREADEVVCLATPERFRAVGCWYQDFRPVDEDVVTATLASAWTPAAAHP